MMEMTVSGACGSKPFFKAVLKPKAFTLRNFVDALRMLTTLPWLRVTELPHLNVTVTEEKSVTFKNVSYI